MRKIAKNLKALAEENTYLCAKCKDLEIGHKCEFTLGRSMNKANMHDWEHNYLHDRRIENCKKRRIDGR